MSLLQSLLNSGVPAHESAVLDQNYGGQSPADFVAGLEEISRVLAFNAPPNPVCAKAEPWATIQAAMLTAQDPEQAYYDTLGQYDTALQQAISGAVGQRINDLQDWQQQAQTKKRKSADYIQILRRLGYRFRWNVCRAEIEVNGEAIHDQVMSKMRAELRDAGVAEVYVAEDAYTKEAWENRYHPIQTYLEQLKWAGQDAIGEVATYFTDEHGYFPLWLRRWAVGAVARVYQNTQNRMLVLEGKQDLGKDYFAAWLCPFGKEYFREGEINPDDKDHRLALMNTWIWDVQELGSVTRRRDREALKSFLTTQVVTERKAYGRYEVQGRAMTSFIGTVNNEAGILNDPTGSRRFMISHILKIDWGYTSVELDQFWAQAYELYLTDEPWRLTGDERALATQINEEYEFVDIVEETISKWFDVNSKEKGWFLPTVEILEVLKNPMQGNLKAGSEVDGRRLAGALTRLGLEKPRPGRYGNRILRGYYGIKRAGP